MTTAALERFLFLTQGVADTAPSRLANAVAALEGIEPSSLTLDRTAGLVEAVLRKGNVDLATTTLAWLRTHHRAITKALIRDHQRCERDGVDHRHSPPNDPHQSWLLHIPPLWGGAPCAVAADLWCYAAFTHTMPDPHVAALDLTFHPVFTANGTAFSLVRTQVRPSFLALLHSMLLSEGPVPVLIDEPPVRAGIMRNILDWNDDGLVCDHPLTDALAAQMTDEDLRSLYRGCTCDNGTDLALLGITYLRAYHSPSTLAHLLHTEGAPILLIAPMSAHTALSIVRDLPDQAELRTPLAQRDPRHTNTHLVNRVAGTLDYHTQFRARLLQQAHTLHPLRANDRNNSR